MKERDVLSHSHMYINYNFLKIFFYVGIRKANFITITMCLMLEKS